MTQHDIFHEVDEDLRREKFEKLWDKYGVFALLGALCIVGAVAAYQGYSMWQTSRANQSGTAYNRAAELATEGKHADAIASLSAIAKEAPGGYPLLANLQMAAVKVQAGQKAEAVALYDSVAATATDPALKDFARIQAATLRVDEADAAEMSRRLEGLNADNNPWRYSAQELLGLSAFRSGNTDESVKMFSAIQRDPHAPAEMRKRAEVMLALLVKVAASGSIGGKDAAATQ